MTCIMTSHYNIHSFSLLQKCLHELGLVLPHPCSAHLSHTLYHVGGDVQVQVHCKHNAVVVFDGVESYVVSQCLVEDLVL